MSSALVELIGSDILCSAEAGGELRLALAASLSKLQDWSRRYDRAAATDHEGELAAIGGEMFAWLDESGWASTWVTTPGDRALEIRVRGGGEAAETALLDAPWELLARPSGPLALDEICLFIVARRIGRPQPPAPPRHGDLHLMFMAAAPEDQVRLDFEGEEVAILDATRRLKLELAVEESGAIDFLQERLAADGPFEAVHLSCHGDIDKNLGPILLLEAPSGGAAPAGPAQLIRALGPDPAALVMLSACRTAELGGPAALPGGPGRRESGLTPDGMTQEGAAAPQRSGPGLTMPFIRLLATKIANLVGWDGSVYDQDAMDFATAFYRALAFYDTVPRAAALARQELLRLNIDNRRRGRHWHLARVYLGAQGGGMLCANTRPKRNWSRHRAEKLFLDKARQRVPVAAPAEFVGRRRAIQHVLRAFRQAPDGVLIHGWGALGKSSLAARVQSRMKRHHPVVIFERYDALAIFDAVAEALEPRTRLAETKQWRELVKHDHAVLAAALESWLAGPLHQAPILLIVDDLERILEPPGPSDAPTGVLPEYSPALAALLQVFESVPTESRLLLTSRYDFRLADGRGGDLAASLIRVPLAPMPARERDKQFRAAERAAGATAALDEEQLGLLDRAFDAAAGNPGLQAILTRPILAGEKKAAATALTQIEIYRRTGAPPADIQALINSGAAKDSENALTAFFGRLSFAAYRAALTPDQLTLLRAATLFSPEIPAPRRALAAAGFALGLAAPENAITRLLGLGLLDDWGLIDAVPHAAANPLARPLAPPPALANDASLARAALPELAAAWRDPDGAFPPDPRGVEASRLARLAGAEPALREAAAYAGAAWLERVKGQTREALAEIADAFASFPADHAVGPGFLRLGIECAGGQGKTSLLTALLNAPVRPPRLGAPRAALSHAQLSLRRAEHLIAIGEIEAGETLIGEARALFIAAGDDREAVRMAAIASGQIADIRRVRGDLDAALRIRQEEQLPVYERLGDVRSRALTMGQIADIRQARGDLDAALRIRQEEELPVYERLGDVRERAVTMGRIADILQARGDLDAALRIRQEEELPVYERLGDVRSRALTMGQIADIRQARGDLDAALRIRQEEELPVYERLGDVRERAVTMGRIADILQARGDLDAALRIRQEEELPVYERLGDVRSRALTMGRIADILQARGDLDAALRIRQEEELPVYERLGDVRERAVTMGRIADILEARGDLDAALRIRQEEQLPVYERLGDVRERAVTMGKIADILQARGDLDAALRIRQEEELPVYERLGDVRERAVTMGKIADIRQARGDLDAALRIRQEEELPVFERLGDVRERAVTLHKIGLGLLRAGGLEQGRIQEIHDALAEAYAIFRRLRAPDGIAHAGFSLAQILALAGHGDDALAILDEVEAAFAMLGNAEGVAAVRGCREEIAKQAP